MNGSPSSNSGSFFSNKWKYLLNFFFFWRCFVFFFCRCCYDLLPMGHMQELHGLLWWVEVTALDNGWNKVNVKWNVQSRWSKIVD